MYDEDGGREVDRDVDYGDVKMVPQVLMWEKRLVRAAVGEQIREPLGAAIGM